MVILTIDFMPIINFIIINFFQETTENSESVENVEVLATSRTEQQGVEEEEEHEGLDELLVDMDPKSQLNVHVKHELPDESKQFC